MKSTSTGISTTQKWITKDTDLSTCTGCKSMIVSAKYVLAVVLEAGTKSETIETNTELCQSCYDALKPEQKNA